MDLQTINELLDQIEKDLHNEVLKQIRNKNNGIATEVTNIRSFLQEIDKNLIKEAVVQEGMIKGGESANDIKQIIDKVNKNVQKHLKMLREKGIDEENPDPSKNKEKLADVYDKIYTFKAQKQLDEIESGSDEYKREDIDTLVDEAEKNLKKAAQICAKKEKYEEVKTTSGKSDDELKKEFKNLKNSSREFYLTLQRLEGMKNYDYVKKLDDLIDSTGSSIEVDDNMRKELEEFKKHLKYIPDKKIAQLLNNVNIEKASIDAIQAALSKVKASNLENVDAIKDNKSAVEKATNEFIQKIDKSNILDMFSEDKERIRTTIGDKNKTAQEKYDVLKKFFSTNKEVVEELSKNTKIDLSAMILTVTKLKEEQEAIKNSSEKPEKPKEVTAVDTTKIDLSDFGLSNQKQYSIGQNSAGEDEYYDLADLNDKQKDDVLEQMYNDICENPDAMRASKEKLGINDNLPANITIGFFGKMWRGIKNIGRRIIGKPTIQEEQAKERRKIEKENREKIKASLSEKIDAMKDVKTQSDENVAKYKEDVANYEKNLASWELTQSQTEKFRNAERQIVVKAAESGEIKKAEDVRKEANKEIVKAKPEDFIR